MQFGKWFMVLRNENKKAKINPDEPQRIITRLCCPSLIILIISYCLVCFGFTVLVHAALSSAPFSFSAKMLINSFYTFYPVLNVR